MKENVLHLPLSLLSLSQTRGVLCVSFAVLMLMVKQAVFSAWPWSSLEDGDEGL